MIDIITLDMAEPKRKIVTTYTGETLYLEDNTEYRLSNVNTLDIDTLVDFLRANVILVAGSTPNISIHSYGVAGDDITTASAGETWELSYFNGLFVCINWGVIT